MKKKIHPPAEVLPFATAPAFDWQYGHVIARIGTFIAGAVAIGIGGAITVISSKLPLHLTQVSAVAKFTTLQVGHFRAFI